MGGELSLFGLDGGDDCEVLETLLGVIEEDGRFIFDLGSGDNKFDFENCFGLELVEDEPNLGLRMLSIENGRGVRGMFVMFCKRGGREKSGWKNIAGGISEGRVGVKGGRAGGDWGESHTLMYGESVSR